MSNVNEIIERLENLAKHAVHCVGEPRFVMSLDDGIALHEAIDLLKAQESVEPIEREGFYYCGKCRYAFTVHRQKYCSECGQAVKWDD